MRVEFQSTRILVLILVFIGGMATGQLVTPIWKLALISAAKSHYQEATYACDRSMRDHMIAKQYLYRIPGKESVTALRSAEVALLDCQDYDILRKRLILWGLNENDLSLMALEAIEAKARDLQQVIEIHEIRY